MKKEDAYDILEQIGIEKNMIGKVYNDLTSEQSFYKLKKKGKFPKDFTGYFYDKANNRIL